MRSLGRPGLKLVDLFGMKPACLRGHRFVCAQLRSSRQEDQHGGLGVDPRMGGRMMSVTLQKGAAQA